MAFPFRNTHVVCTIQRQMVNLDQPIRVFNGKSKLHEGMLARTLGTLATTLTERGDPRGVFAAELSLDIPAAK